MQQKRRILIIESSASVGEMLGHILSPAFGVDTASTAGGADQHLRSARHDAIVVDAAFRSGDLAGMEMIETLRREQDQRPIVVVSGPCPPTLPAHCYDRGADAFLSMPFPGMVLISLLNRLIAVRPYSASPRVGGVLVPVAPFQIAGVEIRSDMTAIFPSGKTAALSPKEVGVLQVIANHQGKLLRRDTVLREVWGASAARSSKSLDTYLVRLRKLFRRHGVGLASILSSRPGLGWLVDSKVSPKP